jgi:hypothetical protein
MQMRGQHRAHHDIQIKAYQFDLFAPSHGSGAVPVPEWRTLPAATRQELTDLMVRLLLERAHGDCHAGQGEACHDD